jgi:5-hydroxyisourate hydrolase
MSAISTHVLDLASGRPAQGVAVVLSARGGDGGWVEVGRGVTDGDGRIRNLMADHPTLFIVDHQLRFDTDAYFRGLGMTSFYPEVVVTFRVEDDASYHVPLLLSPFGYSTYRGS